MQNVPEGYKYKRYGVPIKGEHIVLTNGDVVMCCGRINARCDIVELIEPEKTNVVNLNRREKDAVTT